MTRLEVSSAVRPLYGPLGVKGLKSSRSTLLVSPFFDVLFSFQQVPQMPLLNHSVYGLCFI